MQNKDFKKLRSPAQKAALAPCPSQCSLQRSAPGSLLYKIILNIVIRVNARILNAQEKDWDTQICMAMVLLWGFF